ncbi:MULTISPECIES: ATP-binding protein [unclassified Myxococcus]|uniref:sensor histidine kinase n=1 Tax=unclassified Myxococcus TaxID=2648731 RepID=UPI00157A9E14|nr:MULTISPECIES: ATP-binding protein [unclassified Myxococcus]NTX38444.1 histidine kinase [Myxococcus sp. CA033]NTX53720.1 histidine kinase [Myxococcus sp. CA039A]
MTSVPPDASAAPSDYWLLAGLPTPAAVTRGDQVVVANAALASLLGIPLDELKATPVTALIARFIPAERGWVEAFHEALTRDGTRPEHPLWLRIRRADGKERTVAATYAPGATQEETVVLLHDAEGVDTTRRLTEALGAAAADMLRARDEQEVLETAIDAVHRQGFYSAILLVEGDTFRHGPMRQEPAIVALAERKYGMPISEVRLPLGTLPHLAEVLARRKAAFHQDALGAAHRVHTSEVFEDIQRAYPPGIRALDAPIFVEGQPFGILSAQGLDLTPAAAGTLELFAQLLGGALENVRHHRVAAERLVEVTRLQEELVAHERLTVLGEAAGVVAHEVRNPLGAILNAVAVLRREAHLGPTGQAAVGMLEEEAIRLEDIVRDLLDVVRPLEPRPRLVHLGELVRRALGQLHGPPDAPTLRFTVDEAPDVPEIMGDETLLQLAATHLVRNAVQASPPGGRVRLNVEPVEGGVRLVVEDEGPGIPDVDPRRVFEPFFLTRANGRGLGLAIVKRVVLAHGGQVRASGRPKRGARFEVVLPLGPTRTFPA